MHDGGIGTEVVELVRKLGKIGPTVLITTETRFVEDLGIDSLDLVAVFLGVQDRFDVVIEDEDVAEIKTVGDLVGYIGKRGDSLAA